MSETRDSGSRRPSKEDGRLAYAYAYGCMSTLLDLYLRGLVGDESAARMADEIRSELDENLRQA